MRGQGCPRSELESTLGSTERSVLSLAPREALVELGGVACEWLQTNSIETNRNSRETSVDKSKLMKPFFALAILISGSLCALAALDAVPAPSNVTGAEYARVASDLSVTFQVSTASAPLLLAQNA